jgi:serine/threonine protein kinase
MQHHATQLTLKTLVPSPGSSRSRRTAHYLKKLGKAADACVLEKLATIIDTGSDTHEIYQRRSPNNDSPRASTLHNYERYISIRHLASGGNGSIHLHSDTRIGILVAVKTIYHDDDDDDKPPSEAAVLNYSGYHLDIVQWHTTLPFPREGWRRLLVFEYCSRGDLIDYVKTISGLYPERFLWNIFKHISASLAFLHERGVVHGDIKLADILLTFPRPGSL